MLTGNKRFFAYAQNDKRKQCMSQPVILSAAKNLSFRRPFASPAVLHAPNRGPHRPLRGTCLACGSGARASRDPWLGHAAALTAHRAVIHYRVGAFGTPEGKAGMVLIFLSFRRSRILSFSIFNFQLSTVHCQLSIKKAPLARCFFLILRFFPRSASPPHRGLISGSRAEATRTRRRTF